MKATFHGEKLLTVEGTPLEIKNFKDLMDWGPQLPKKPFRDVMPPWTIGDPPGSIGSGSTGTPIFPPTTTTTRFYAGSGITYAEKSE